MERKKSLKDTALDRKAVMSTRAANLGGSETADLDLAIVKATNRDEVFPKEKHVRTVLHAASNTRYALYTFRSLTKRLKAPNNSWLIVVKTLMVFHRCIRDGGKTSRQGLLQHLNENTGAFDCSNFKDDSSKDAWERGAWARNYAAYLEERLHTLRALGYEKDEACTGESSVMRQLDTVTLLRHLDNLQTLLRRLLNTKPESKVVTESQVIVGAIACIVRESFKIYQTTQDGIINLVDKFFEMDYLNAKKAFEVYRLSIKQTENLTAFYRALQSVPSMSNIDLPSMEKPPESFLMTMEEYLQNAPARPASTSVSSPGRARAGSSSGSGAKPRSFSTSDSGGGALIDIPLPESSPALDGGRPSFDGNNSNSNDTNTPMHGLETLVSPSEFGQKAPATATPSATGAVLTPAAAPQGVQNTSPAAVTTTPAATSSMGTEPNMFNSSFNPFGAVAPGSGGPVASSGSVGALNESPGVDSSSSGAMGPSIGSGSITKNDLDQLYNQAIVGQPLNPSAARMHDPSVFSVQPYMTYVNQPMSQAQQQQWNVQMQQMNMQMQQMEMVGQPGPKQQQSQGSPPQPPTQPSLL